jgi:chromosome segregation ATPase
MPSDDRVVLLHRIRKTILDVDLFEVLKQDSTACFVMKGLLNQVDLATCSLEVSTILFELQSLLDNVTGCLLQDESAAIKVQEKRASMNAAYEHASKLSKEAEEQATHIKQARADYELRSQSILLWEKQIQELQHKIKEAQQQQIAYESNTFGHRFEELLNKGLAETEAAEQLKGEVAILEGAKRFTQKRLESFRNIFDRLRNNPHF